MSLTKPFFCVGSSAGISVAVPYVCRFGTFCARILFGSKAYSSMLYLDVSDSAVDILCDMPLAKNATSPSSGGLIVITVCADDLREDNVEKESLKELSSNGRSC